MLTRTVWETRTTGRLTQRGNRVLDLVRLSDSYVVYYATKQGKVRYRQYRYPTRGGK